MLNIRQLTFANEAYKVKIPTFSAGESEGDVEIEEESPMNGEEELILTFVHLNPIAKQQRTRITLNERQIQNFELVTTLSYKQVTTKNTQLRF